MIIPQKFLRQGVLNSLLNLGAWSYHSFGLFQNDVIPTRTSKYADFVAASFDGYAPQSITPTQFHISMDENQEVLLFNTNGIVFDTASPWSTLQTIYGYYAWDGSYNLVYAGRFDNPITAGYRSQQIALSAAFYDH